MHFAKHAAANALITGTSSNAPINLNTVNANVDTLYRMEVSGACTGVHYLEHLWCACQAMGGGPWVVIHWPGHPVSQNLLLLMLLRRMLWLTTFYTAGLPQT